MNDRAMTLRLSEELFKKLKAESFETDQPMSEIIRAAIEKHLEAS